MASNQVTPPVIRVWAYGIGATALASMLNYGWWWLCVNAFHWIIFVPGNFDSNQLIDASALRIVVTTVVIGLVATLGATLLAKVFIGPRWWWVVVSIAVSASSLYGAATLTNIDLMMKIRLSVFHLLTMITIIPLMFRALKVGMSDLENTYRVHERASTQPETNGDVAQHQPTHTGPQEQAPDYNLNETLVMPPRDDSEFNS